MPEKSYHSLVDCKAVYLYEYDDEKGVLTLQKADLNLP